MQDVPHTEATEEPVCHLADPPLLLIIHWLVDFQLFDSEPVLKLKEHVDTLGIKYSNHNECNEEVDACVVYDICYLLISTTFRIH